MAQAPEDLPTGGAGLAFAVTPAARTGTWFLAEPLDQSDTLAMQSELGGHSPWDLAHTLRQELAAKGVPDVQAIEPDFEQAWVIENPRAASSLRGSSPSSINPSRRNGGRCRMSTASRGT